MRKFFITFTMILVILTGLCLLYEAVMNQNVSEDASFWGGVGGLFCIIFGTIWLHE